MIRLILIVCLLPFSAVTVAGELRFEGRHDHPLPGHEDRSTIEASLTRVRSRLLLFKNEQAQGPTVETPTVRLDWPVREGVNFTSPSVQSIANFLDQNPMDDLLDDWNCGGDDQPRTYDTHRGLDVFTAPFSWYQMEQDAGIVVAAAPGVIVDKVDNLPDRSCDFNDKDGNIVTIQHADGSIAFYAHMRTGSATKKAIGDAVETGDYLGVIGSSGISTGPHLHFEVGFFENNVWVPQDPYAGSCNDINSISWWNDQPSYYEPQVTGIGTHDAAPQYPTCPTTEVPNYANDFSAGDTIFFSVTFRDLLLNQQASIDILTPNGLTFTSTSITADQPHIASPTYSFSLGLPGNAMAGAWTYRVRFEGETVEHTFRVDSPVDPPAPIAAANNAYNGLWYDPALDGEGYNIVTSALGTAIYYYGNDANGKRLWLVSELLGDAFQDGNMTTIRMFESSGGTFAAPIPSGRGLADWGTLKLTFSGCTAGTARLEGRDGNKVSALTKLTGVPGSNCIADAAVPATPWSGLWFDPSLEGEGFNLIVTPFGSALYYYGFDEDGDRLWLVTAPFEFTYGNGAQTTVELLRASQGEFDNPAANALESWGTMTITGVSCDRMDYSLSTNDGTKQMSAQRLVGVTGLDCS